MVDVIDRASFHRSLGKPVSGVLEERSDNGVFCTIDEPSIALGGMVKLALAFSVLGVIEGINLSKFV